MTIKSDWKESAQGLFTKSKRTNQRDGRETGADPLGHCSLSEEGSPSLRGGSPLGPQKQAQCHHQKTLDAEHMSLGPRVEMPLKVCLAKELSSSRRKGSVFKGGKRTWPDWKPCGLSTVPLA